MSGYDVDRLRAALDAALAEFIQDDQLLPGTRDAVVASVTTSALYALRFFCGEPNATRPRGLLTNPTLCGYPIVEHEPCDDPACRLCAQGTDVFFGKLRE